MWKNTYSTYGSFSKTLHWLIFFLLLFMLIYGYSLEFVPKAYQGMAYNIHKLTGLTILVLMLLRLLWKLSNVTPLLPADTPPWQRGLDHLVQWLLYLTVIGMPIAGWVGASAMGRPPSLGKIALALPIEHNKTLADQAFLVHNTIAVIIIVLVSVHILAALYHYIIKKDRILERMLPYGDR